MPRHRLRPIVVALALATSAAAPALAYQAMQGPTEVLWWDQARAFNGYTLFAAHGTTYLIDMAGNVVHRWNLGTNPKLLDNGHLLDATHDDPSGFAGFEEVDWDGQVVWTYTEQRVGYAPHHDFVRIHNPALDADTTLYIANRTVTNAEALAAGADPANGPYDGASLDCVVEVDAAGTVIWQWCFVDHLIQDVSATLPHHVGAGRTLASFPGRLDANLPGRPLRRDWLHCNSLDYNQQLDQVVINSVQGELYVIDHGATFRAHDPAASLAAAASSAGDFLYRFGDPARYEQGDPPSIPANWDTASSGHKQLGGAHDAHWIRPGLPGAGHLLVFNNGQYLHRLTNQSYAVEIAPYLDGAGVDSGHYVNPPVAGYTRIPPEADSGKPPYLQSKQIVWSWGAHSNVAMFSHIGGSAQRLPNGNTLVCADTEGHLVEVTSGSDPALVWEYVSPVTRAGALKVMPDSPPMTNSLFRAYRFAPDHPAFVGRTLTPQGPITGGSGQPDAGPSTPDAGVDAASCPAAADGGGGCQSAGSTGTGLALALVGFALGATTRRRSRGEWRR